MYRPLLANLAAIFLFASTGASVAADVTLETPVGCDIFPLKDRASETRIERFGEILHFTVRANAQCGARPEDPRIFRNADIARISVTYDRREALHGCYCARTIRFSVSNMWPEVRTIYYIQDGQITGHADVP